MKFGFRYPFLMRGLKCLKVHEAVTNVAFTPFVCLFVNALEKIAVDSKIFQERMVLIGSKRNLSLSLSELALSYKDS